jgi:hypothetical protein
MEGMASKNAAQSEPRTSKQSVASDRLFSEARTGRFEAAARTEKGVNHEPIDPEEGANHEVRLRRLISRITPDPVRVKLNIPQGTQCAGSWGRSRSRSGLSFRSSSSNESEAPDRRAITTRSCSHANSRLFSRNQARIRRFKRLRTTAPPTFLLAVIPSRLPTARESSNILDLRCFLSSGAEKMTRSRFARRRPLRSTRRKSLESRRRSDRRKRPVSIPTFYLDATVAASRFRPFARRRFKMARPAFVFILSRKPCLRRRLIRLGWYVRFMFADPHSRLIWFERYWSIRRHGRTG